MKLDDPTARYRERTPPAGVDADAPDGVVNDAHLHAGASTFGESFPKSLADGVRAHQIHLEQNLSARAGDCVEHRGKSLDAIA